MVLGRGELRPAVLARLGHGELEEALGRAVVEPVHDLTGDDAVGFRVVGKDFDIHPLVDDLADLFLGAVRQGDSRRIGHAAEHDSDLFAELVDEDRGGLGLAQRAGELTQGLGHQARLEADVTVAHLALDLRLRYECGHRVDDDDVDGARPDQHVGDFQRLLAGVRLGDEQRVGVDAQLLGVIGVERVLGVDERGDAAALLRVRDRVQRHCRVVRQHAVREKAVSRWHDNVEGRLKPTILDGDDILVGIWRLGEHPEILHDQPRTRGQPVLPRSHHSTILVSRCREQARFIS